jgi:hypothetical protein
MTGKIEMPFGLGDGSSFAQAPRKAKPSSPKGEGIVASIAGTLKVGEARATAIAIRSRQFGSRASYAAIRFGLMGVGLIAGLIFCFLIAGPGSPDYELYGAVGCAAGGVVFLLANPRIMSARFKRKFKERQHRLELNLRMEIRPEHLSYEIGGVKYLVQWTAVDELFRSHDYWLVSAQAHLLFAPRRLFANEDDERALLRKALALMSEQARARSGEAVQFSGFLREPRSAHGDRALGEVLAPDRS